MRQLVHRFDDQRPFGATIADKPPVVFLSRWQG
jgi:hypothetical protein